MASEKILLVDDDADMREVLQLYLKKNGYLVFTAEDGVDAIRAVEESNPDLILLDVMMPNLDGLEFLPIIRKKTEVPVLLLSSKNDDIDTILGLSVGGDDYISKTTSMPVIVSKVRAHLRRNRILADRTENTGNQPQSERTIIEYPGLTINLVNAEVIANGSVVKLSAKEYQLLCLMARNPERIYTVEKLFELIWAENSLGDYRTVMVHLSNLRKKIELNPNEPQYILTLRGIGYKFNASNM
ncbi:DNA-binding response regulator [Oceanobacillus arenosus]|uniref:DNA-binding response regulator n=1 Tax=Oceanobacillus arenosus TaxID=1229153 RepID=A0A3D8PLK7_9BACI|nr:response regulator transcription factor [Oceanobacillus arenosus]RDW16904.1 DNA-binding response regulator [Oceanobacillus arenosus]